jgi:hypothetical protein
MTGNTLPRTPSQALGFDLAPLYDAIGIPTTHLDSFDIAHQALCATIAHFSEGEINPPAMVTRMASSEPFSGQLFGEITSQQGEFGIRLDALHQGSDPELAQQAASFMELASGYLVNHLIISQPKLMPPKTVAIASTRHAPTRLDFDNTSSDLYARPTRVIDYGPGIHGAHYIHQQFRDAGKATQPYEYHPSSKGPFVHGALTELAQRLQAATTSWHPLQQDAFKNSLKSRGDGMASASAELAHTMEGMFGLAIASMIHTADPEAVETTLYNTFDLLSEQGTLLIRAPGEPYADHLTADNMLEMALEAPFDKKKIIKHQAPRTALPSGHVVTPTSYVLYK